MCCKRRAVGYADCRIRYVVGGVGHVVHGFCLERADGTRVGKFLDDKKTEIDIRDTGSPRGAPGSPREPQGSPRGAPGRPRAPQGAAGSRREPQGAAGEPQGSRRGAPGEPQGSPREPQGAPGEPQGAAGTSFHKVFRKVLRRD